MELQEAEEAFYQNREKMTVLIIVKSMCYWLKKNAL